MNTVEEELKALRKELDELRNGNFVAYEDLSKQNTLLLDQILSLRQENIALCKELSNQHQTIINIMNFFASKNLKNHLTRLTGMQTAKFIVDNMNKVKSFSDKENYLHYLLTQISTAVGEGVYLEFGVYQGYTINFISSILRDKVIYGFDSFEGLPETWREGFVKKAFNVNGNLPQVNENVRLVKGWFNETLPAFVKEHPEPCAFIHVDCDLYSSTKTIFDNLKNQIVSGTIIAFDEYFNYPGWQEGEYKAFMEFILENHLEFEYIARTEHEQVAVKIK